ncbi:glutathione S-transferase family protein [Vibrio viridaestus]|uniref:Glutathione S-transferase n=1 Tax=Vibrio viridaestus TaxID=2487322 RepID=A0A3N9TJY5_9VIBR|nr:glutathione S-transferase N-terminal domain-containing protein [Vibrio viridaestus]RQW64587.1 glutathione S-transferase [Vibrio viridaestus]
MKLYELAPSPSCIRVSIFLKLLDVEIERHPVDLRSGENLTTKFTELSKNAKVPVLQIDDETYISESVAICRYIDGVTPNEQHLFGETVLEQASVEMWNRIVEWQGLIPAFQAFRNISKAYADRETCSDEWGVVSKGRTEEFLPVLDSQLASNEFVAGDKLSIADITAFVFIKFIESRLSIQLTDMYPNIFKWVAKLNEKDAFNM